MRLSATIIVTLSLSACTLAGGLDASDPTAGNAPPAVDGSRHGVDGLEVGHRLMEAGEYELALKAYYRAGSEIGINSDVLSAIGSADLKLGRLNQAEQVLRRALEDDPTFVPAINNLGVVLMEERNFGEARAMFQRAYALDSGTSDEIRDNLRLAIARTTKNVYDDPVTTPDAPAFNLVRRGEGDYVLLSQL
ncbi:MAG: tetratricopeptide repeat protein [bacterium]